MSDQTLISYAQNGEDVVLWRALAHVSNGRYVDVGACDPVSLSVTKALYDRGWRGIDIDAVPEYADRLREARPGNEVVCAAITDRQTSEVAFHQLVDTGLSTLMAGTAEQHEAAGFERKDITVPALSLDAACERSQLLTADLHLLKVDVEGAEAEVMRSFDLMRWRPWVVVVEATQPLSNKPSYAEWEPLLVDAGWTFTLFDGLSRFYVSPDHPELLEALSYPACSLDDFVPVSKHLQDVRVDRLSADLDRSLQDVIRWRGQAVGYWSNAVARVQRAEDDARQAREQAARLRRQVVKVRENLQNARDDRRRLRARVQRMRERIQRLEQRPLVATVPRPRLRSALARLRGS